VQERGRHRSGRVQHRRTVLVIKRPPPRTAVGSQALAHGRVLEKNGFLWARYPCTCRVPCRGGFAHSRPVARKPLSSPLGHNKKVVSGIRRWCWPFPGASQVRCSFFRSAAENMLVPWFLKRTESLGALVYTYIYLNIVCWTPDCRSAVASSRRPVLTIHGYLAHKETPTP